MTMDPSSYNHNTVLLSTGRKYHFVDQKPADYDATLSTTLLYGWRYQIMPWVRKGYRVIVPDMLGYGGTDKPADPSEYSTKKLCTDLAALLNWLGIKQAVVVGHDWGSFIAGRFALWFPQRIQALVLMSVPYTPPTRSYMPIEEVAKRAPNLGYQVYFANPASTTEIEQNLHNFLAVIFRPPRSDPDFTTLKESKAFALPIRDSNHADIKCLLDNTEFDYYAQELGKGMLGPLNYYRTSKHRFEEEQTANPGPNLPVDLPVLFIWGDEDRSCVSSHVAKAQKFIDRLRIVTLEGKGHWVMIEAPQEITETVADWLHDVAPRGIINAKL